MLQAVAQNTWLTCMCKIWSSWPAIRAPTVRHDLRNQGLQCGACIGTAGLESTVVFVDPKKARKAQCACPHDKCTRIRLFRSFVVHFEFFFCAPCSLCLTGPCILMSDREPTNCHYTHGKNCTGRLVQSNASPVTDSRPPLT